MAIKMWMESFQTVTLMSKIFYAMGCGATQFKMTLPNDLNFIIVSIRNLNKFIGYNVIVI